MPKRSSRKNNVVAGLFVLVALAGAVAISIVLSGVAERLRPTRQVTFLFPLDVGAMGIRPGSSVLLGGQPVGRVTGASPVRDAAEGLAISVSARIDSFIELHRDADVFLLMPLLGSTSSINISDVGTGETVGASDAIIGRLAPPTFLRAAGFGPEQIAQFQRVVADSESLVAHLDAIAADVESVAGPTLDDAHRAVADVQAMTEDVRQRLPAWSDAVDATLRTVAEASDSVARAAEGLDQRSQQAGRLLESTQALIDENRPRIDKALASIESAAGRIDGQTLGKANEALDRASADLDSLAELSERVRTIVEEELPGIRRTLANLRLASDQVKLAMVEIRRAPWRLLHTPGTKELDSELLFDAARTYAMAVSDLRSASESLESVTKLGATPTPDDQELARMRAHLAEAFTRYQEAEQSRLDLMTEKAP